MAMMAAGALMTQMLVKYNRKGFFQDKELRQEREFQEQDMRIKQFQLYREDVRDLVNLTTSKMDLYLIIGALMADKTMQMIAKQNEALPAPEWALELNVLSLGSAVLYLMMSMWLAIYASVAAHAYGTRLLTQYIRLPIASESYLQNATATSQEFEGASMNDLMRVPFLQRGRPPVGESGPSSSSNAASRVEAAEAQPDQSTERSAQQSSEPERDLPTAMLDHIRLYRKVQLHWQAYDAYARVGLFLGANCILYSCLYWSLGQLIENQNATLPELGTALIFATLQLALSRLDLRLRKSVTTGLCGLVITMPLCTTAGMVVYTQFLKDLDPKAPRSAKIRFYEFVVDLLAFFAHCLHAAVGGLVLWAISPDKKSNENFEYTVYLPGRFRTVLYLDVFGWLANRKQEAEASQSGEDALPDRASPFAGSSPRLGRLSTVPEGGTQLGSTMVTDSMMRATPTTSLLQTLDGMQGINEAPSPPISRVGSIWSDVGGASPTTGPAPSPLDEELPLRARFERHSSGFDFREDVQEHATQIFLSEPQRNATQVAAYGGDEAVQPTVINEVVAPSAETAASFLPAEAGLRRQSKKLRLPGERPWHAMCTATTVVVVIWSCSAVWAFTRIRLFFGQGWRTHDDPSAALLMEPPVSLLTDLCSAAETTSPPWLRWHLSRSLTDFPGEGAATSAGRRIIDLGCGLQRSSIVDVALACEHEALTAASQKHCMAALLRRGGRSIALCQLEEVTRVQPGLSAGSQWLARPKLSARLAAGASPLAQLTFPSFSNRSQDINFFARNEDGVVLALQIEAAATWSTRPQGFIARPLFDLSQADESASGDSRMAIVHRPSLALASSPSAVYSVATHVMKMDYAATCSSTGSKSACQAAGSSGQQQQQISVGLRIERWSLHDGVYSQAFLPGVVGTSQTLLESICN